MSATTEPVHEFAPEERPAFPGSPATPWHPLRRRFGYAGIAVMIGLTATLGNALVTVNVANLSGALGVDLWLVSWLPAIYVAFNASANLTLAKARAQFGIPPVARTLLVAYALATLLQVAFPGFATATIVRAVCGMSASMLITLTIYHLLQVFPGPQRPRGLVAGIGLVQLGTPLARLVPVEMLALDHWRGLHLIELALALGTLALLSVLPLPPTEKTKSFEPLDFVTIALMIPAYLLVCGVLNTGRILWWTDTPWLGVALAAAVMLFVAAWLVERHRQRPLVHFEWIATLDIARFAAVALLVRFALAEQTYGAVGLLTSGNLTNDQLHTLFAIVAVSMLLGIAAACRWISEQRAPWLVMTAALIIAAGAWIDTDATNVTRPPQLYLSQALIGFGTTLFIGPALAFGFLKMMRRGADHLVTYIVLFSTTQNVGGLVGSACLGSLQVIQTRAHAAALSEHLIAADPQVVERIVSGAAALAGIVTDPAARAAQGAGLLVREMAREAGILAFNDVFMTVFLMALATAGFVATLIVLRHRRQATAETHS